MQPQTATQSLQAASPFRWWVLTLLFLSISVNLLDRQVLSVAAPLLRDTLGISAEGYGRIVFGFMFGMALMQLPAGMILDRWGARLGLAAMCTWWSVANMMHALARTVPQFAACRFLLGMGECGNYSGGVKVVTQWFPPRERALAAGIFNSGSLAGPIVAVPLITWLMLRFGWQSAFVLSGSVGLAWALLWALTYRNPTDSRKSQAPVAHLEADRIKTPEATGQSDLKLGQLFRIRQTWGVLLMRGLAGPVSQFYWYWLPEYLKRERHLTLVMIGLIAWLPYFWGGVGNLAGGWLSGNLIRRGWTVDSARKFCLGLAALIAATSGLIPLVSSTAVAVALICAAVMGINAWASVFMASIGDIFPERAVARVAGITGIGDAGFSMVAMLATGVVVERFSYFPVFVASAALPIMALLVLLFVVRRVEPYLPRRLWSAGQ